MEDSKDKTYMLLSLMIFLAFLAYLIFLYKKEQPIATTSKTSTLNANSSPQIIYVKSPNSDEVIKTEETRPTWPHIINHNLHNANQIYEIKIPREGVRAWSLRCRSNVNLQYSFEPSFSTYMTLSAGETLNQDTNSNGSIYAIYVRSATAEVVTELELWRN